MNIIIRKYKIRCFVSLRRRSRGNGENRSSFIISRLVLCSIYFHYLQTEIKFRIILNVKVELAHFFVRSNQNLLGTERSKKKVSQSTQSLIVMLRQKKTKKSNLETGVARLGEQRMHFSINWPNHQDSAHPSLPEGM